MDLKNFIRDIPNFPKDGIIYKDITPLLKDAQALKYTTQSLLELVGSLPVDKVIGMESRGYFFASLLAKELNAGFVPVRKKGKLPYKTLSEEFFLEYGTDILEIHEDAIQPGDNVLIHDDVLATGGTAKATCNLVNRLGGTIVQCNFLIELSFLQGKDKLQSYNIHSLLTY